MSSILNITQPQLQTFSFTRSISSTTPNFNFIIPKLTQLSLKRISPIRMGGGPRTFPGGVSKWQWKRMQAKKAKQLLKARLCRERQIYEMRKRAELKSAVAELEKPWEVVERAPTLFSVKADEQLKVLADRFQRAGGFDMWSDRDGPQLFGSDGDDDDEFPSTRFFPKGVVHSLKPYQKVSDLDYDDDGLTVTENGAVDKNGGRQNSMRRLKVSDLNDDDDGLFVNSLDSITENGGKNMVDENVSRRNSMRRLKSGSGIDGQVERKQLSLKSRESSNEDPKQGNAGAMESKKRNVIRKKGSRQIPGSLDSKQGNGRQIPGSLDSKQGNGDSEPSASRRSYHLRRIGDSSVKKQDFNSKVFDMNLKHDGRYEL